MSLPIRFLPEAKAEFDDASDWYERKQTALGAAFVARVRAVLHRISHNPRMHGTVHGEVRKALVRRFPYIVLYLEDEDAGEVLIISVFHTSRDPAVWQARLDPSSG
jgi:plasmid stabilization system protein ParE